MPSKVNVVTGGTGLLGSHIAEQLIARGEKVRALVRSTSDTTFLQSIGAELVQGDLLEPDSLEKAFEGATIVYHCAAKVGDWGPWSLFEERVINGTRNVLKACETAQVKRLLHVSSVTVYGHPKARGELFTEEEPLGQNLWLWDYYCRSKIEAEKLCRESPCPITIVRPSWIFGPRDRNTIPRIFKAISSGRARLIGSGENKLNIVYAGDVADGAIRAANHPEAVGEAFNLCSEGELTQRELLHLLCNELGRKPIKRRFPFRVAFWAGFFSEVVGRIIRLKRPPHITRYGVGLIGRPTLFSSEKAKTQLQWQQRMPMADGLRLAIQWYRDQARSAKKSSESVG